MMYLYLLGCWALYCLSVHAMGGGHQPVGANDGGSAEKSSGAFFFKQHGSPRVAEWVSSAQKSTVIINIQQAALRYNMVF